MSTVDALRLMQVIREEIEKLPERSGGYRRDVFKSLSTVIVLERQHVRTSINIQESQDQVEVLGKGLHQDNGTMEQELGS